MGNTNSFIEEAATYGLALFEEESWIKVNSLIQKKPEYAVFHTHEDIREKTIYEHVFSKKYVEEYFVTPGTF